MSRILLVIPILLLNACASLDVQVATLNPEYVRDQLAAQTEANTCRQAISESAASIQDEVNKLARDLQAHHDLVYNTYIAAIKPTDQYASALMEFAKVNVKVSSDDIDPMYGLEGYRQSRISAMLAVRGAVAALGDTEAPCTKRSPALISALNMREALVKTKAAEIAAALEKLRNHVGGSGQGHTDNRDKPTTGPQNQSNQADANSQAGVQKAVAAEPKVATSQQAISRMVTSALGDGALRLTTTPYAYLVSSADEAHWHPKFNEAFGSGSMGNLDIAITLNATADFSVKGMRFDADKVAEIASKVTSQALYLAVQMTGVAPVASANPPANPNASALAQSTAALAAVQNQDATRESLRRTRTRALFDLADSLIAYHDLVTEANKDETAGSIRARLNAQLPLLKLQPAAPSPTQ